MNLPIETIPAQIQLEDDRTGLSLATLRRALVLLVAWFKDRSKILQVRGVD
jgi:hypothetical protein